MHFIVQINGQVFRVLLFDDLFVLLEDLMIEIKRILQWRILVEVPADRHEDACFAGRNRTGSIQDMKLSVIREKYA